MIAIVRYVLADAARRQRWVAPAALFLVAVAVANVNAGPLLTTYADTAVCLLGTGIWLTWAILGAEDPVQCDVSAMAVGSTTYYRAGKILAAFCVSAALGLAASLTPVVAGAHPALSTSSLAGDFVAGLVAHLVVAAFAAAVGAVVSRPVLRAGAWAFYLGAAITLADVIVPSAPPARQVLDLFDQDHPAALAGHLGLTAAETLLLCGVAFSLSLLVAARRD